MYTSRGSTDVAASARPKSRRSRLELAVAPAAVRIARQWTADQLASTRLPGQAAVAGQAAAGTQEPGTGERDSAEPGSGEPSERPGAREAGPGAGEAAADDLIDSAVLVVSELVTNAIQAVQRITPALTVPDRAVTAAPVVLPVLAAPALAGRILSFAEPLPGPLAPRPLAPGLAVPWPRGVAARPADRRVALVIAQFSALVRIEVHDTSPVPLPPACQRDDDEESGRGLTVVAALAQSWGWQPEPFGKIVWCELAREPDE